MNHHRLGLVDAIERSLKNKKLKRRQVFQITQTNSQIKESTPDNFKKNPKWRNFVPVISTEGETVQESLPDDFQKHTEESP